MRFYGNDSNSIMLGVFSEFGLLIYFLLTKLFGSVDWYSIGCKTSEVKKWFIALYSLFGIIFLNLFSYIFAYFGGLQRQFNAHLINFISLQYHSTQIIYLIWLIVLIPSIEELFFRGVFFTYLKETSGLKIALLLQAILFAIVHDYNPYAFSLHFMSGLLYGYLFYKCNSLYPCIFMHSLNNFFNLLISI